jgi:peptide/nickel transport system substrate-binding protein
MKLFLLLCFVFFGCHGVLPKNDRTLNIGLAIEPSSLDPHKHVFGANIALMRHMFDPLIIQDDHQKLTPGLATSWVLVNPTTWKLTLRRDVKFHDGSLFTAKDVLYSFNRIRKAAGLYSPFESYIRHIKSFETPDNYTLIINTHTPYALTDTDLSLVSIVKNNMDAGVDFHKGTGIIGTGPYKIKGWRPGSVINFTRFDNYWGGCQPWSTLNMYIIVDQMSRVMALLSGKVQIIEAVSSLNRVALTVKGFGLCAIPSRLMYVAVDWGRSPSPFARNHKNMPLYPSPLRHLGVREALSRSINRKLLVNKLLDGQAIPAYQLASSQTLGYLPGLTDIFNLPRAKQLLNNAGYGQGFMLHIHGPSGRYLQDTKVLESLGTMWSHLGLKVKVSSLISNVFFAQSNALKFSVALYSMPLNREASPLFKNILHTYDPQKGFGSLNRSRFSYTPLDTLIQQSLITFDINKRAKILQKANRLAMDRQAVIPLYFSQSQWAFHPSVTYTPRTDDYTLAMGVQPKTVL